jgi:hypothetical protein
MVPLAGHSVYFYVWVLALPVTYADQATMPPRHF